MRSRSSSGMGHPQQRAVYNNGGSVGASSSMKQSQTHYQTNIVVQDTSNMPQITQKYKTHNLAY